MTPRRDDKVLNVTNIILQGRGRQQIQTEILQYLPPDTSPRTSSGSSSGSSDILFTVEHGFIGAKNHFLFNWLVQIYSLIYLYIVLM